MDPLHGAEEAESSLLTVVLGVPPPWSDAIAATAAALHSAYPSLPPPAFAPHISLRQRFVSATPARAAASVARALRGLPPARVQVNDVHAFLASNGSAEVVYLAVTSPWLALAHLRIVRETEAIAAPPAPGNPAFELRGFQPHITLAVLREVTDVALRHAVVTHAAELWNARRPAAEGFVGTTVLLSRWQTANGAETIRAFTLGAPSDG